MTVRLTWILNNKSSSIRYTFGTNDFAELNCYMSTYTALGWVLWNSTIDFGYLQTKALLQSTKYNVWKPFPWPWGFSVTFSNIEQIQFFLFQTKSEATNLKKVSITKGMSLQYALTHYLFYFLTICLQRKGLSITEEGHRRHNVQKWRSQRHPFSSPHLRPPCGLWSLSTFELSFCRQHRHV